MKALARFADLEYKATDGLPRVAECVGKLDPEVKQAVLAYLKNGCGVYDVMEATSDPLNPKAVISGGPSLITDGYWVWRLDLAHYVEAYNVSLPEEFVQAAINAASNCQYPKVNVAECWRAATKVFGWA